MRIIQHEHNISLQFHTKHGQVAFVRLIIIWLLVFILGAQ